MSKENSSIPNNKVYFDIQIGNEPAGRMIISLFTSAAPRACENFRNLCTGENSKGIHSEPLNYKGSAFHRVIPGLICEGGIITNKADYGTEGESSNERDTFVRDHSIPGMLSMANLDPVSNESSFFICMSEGSPCKNGERCLGFGQVIGGLHVLVAIQSVGSVNGMTEKAVIIKDCGQLFNDSKYMPSLSSSGTYGRWSLEDFDSDMEGGHTSNALESSPRSFLHERKREKSENEYVPILDEHLMAVANINKELTKLLGKETDLKGLLSALSGEKCLPDLRKLLSEIETKIHNLKKKITILNVISSLPNEGVLEVKSVLKKYGAHIPGYSGSD